MIIESKEDGLISSLVKETQGSETKIGEKSVRYAFNCINVIARDDNVISVKDIKTWERGGSETYISVVDIKLGSSYRRLIAKALVPFGERPHNALQKRLERREDIKRLGIRVPHLYSTYKATIYERYISNRVRVSDIKDIGLRRQIGMIGGILDRSKYNHINYIKDLRHDGSTVYLTDFGFDIGGRSTNSETTCLMQIKSNGIHNTDEILKGYKYTFEES